MFELSRAHFTRGRKNAETVADSNDARPILGVSSPFLRVLVCGQHDDIFTDGVSPGSSTSKTLSMSSCSLGDFTVSQHTLLYKYGACMENLCMRRPWTRYWSIADHADAPGDQLGNMKGMKNQLGNCRKRSSRGYIRLPLTVKFQAQSPSDESRNRGGAAPTLVSSVFGPHLQLTDGTGGCDNMD
ncbi:hypothetical protein BDQ94DRAFT_163753 [Aspergillus welwitschiae]|uniref:Uncharacterized protein n=1 Tax=Aspergillus welwitschiae TaxID=1341132 RepID=A0A3F3PK18_9EURO|nr:hypothetical protein BDQ94DRAFT_163753 [Aspergillus welwitschiae]RDH27289.1 hypothetical protein BDQ94DRAFT_163753 [Aspergillus welwitschiae]